MRDDASKRAAALGAVRFAVDENEARVGRTLAGKYRLESILGRGGMGCVYRAVHVELGAPVAVKFLRSELTARAELRARFQREAVVLANLRHPGIVSVLDAGDDEGAPYLVMELLAGQTLTDYANVLAGCSTRCP